MTDDPLSGPRAAARALRTRFDAVARQAAAAAFARAGLGFVGARELGALRSEREKLFEHASREPALDRSFEGVIFSMDRPAQLDALLRSFYLHSAPQVPLTVLYRASHERAQAAYAALEAEHAGRPVTFVRERHFRDDLCDVLGAARSSRVFFLVDDIVFTRRVEWSRLADVDPKREVFSLRLWPGLTHCYALRRPLRSPVDLQRVTGDEADEADSQWSWRWRGADADWGYVQSVDGNVFDRAEARTIAATTSFRSPNTFEPAIGRYADLLGARLGRCFGRSRLVNIPANRVQSEVANRSQEDDGASVEQLLARYERGQRVDVLRYKDLNNESVHMELPLYFLSPDSSR